MNSFELIGLNVIFLVSSVLGLLLICDHRPGGPEERRLRHLFLVGFFVFHGARWIPFAVVLGRRIFLR